MAELETKTIVITDLTQMPRGDRVCVVGIDDSNRCVRLIHDADGVPKSHLYIGSALVIRPRARIRCRLFQVRVDPPHIEDRGFDPASVVDLDLCSDAEWKDVLSTGSFSTVGDIYDGLLHRDQSVEPGANTRSIGTLSQVAGVRVRLEEGPRRPESRLLFTDSARVTYNAPITDLAFQELTYAEIRRQNRPLEAVAEELTKLVMLTRRVYLRIGLARPWTNSVGKRACWMMVTGIHTFPDYLQGKSFADFESPS